MKKIMLPHLHAELKNLLQPSVSFSTTPVFTAIPTPAPTETGTTTSIGLILIGCK
jgi:hypothetical protein